MTGTLRQPNGQVVVCGNSIPFTDLQVVQTRTKKGDTFTATTALTIIEQGMGLSWWLTQEPMPVTCSINGTQVFTGNIDKLDMDFAGRTFTMSGRDVGAAMMDKQTTQKWQNQQPNQIVSQIAGSHGIPVNMDTASLDSGKMYSSDFDALSTRCSEWSLIQRLADLYGMVAYLTGGTLYFKNYNEQLSTYQITYQAPTSESFENGNFILLTASRNVNLAKGVKVTVNSHNHRKKDYVSATSTSSGGGGSPLIFNHYVPMLNQDQAQTIATAKMNEIASHELTIEKLDIPGNEQLNARMQIQLSGTNSPLDTTYDINELEHSLTFQGGFRTGIRLKNKNAGGGQ